MRICLDCGEGFSRSSRERVCLSCNRKRITRRAYAKLDRLSPEKLRDWCSTMTAGQISLATGVSGRAWMIVDYLAARGLEALRLCRRCMENRPAECFATPTTVRCIRCENLEEIAPIDLDERVDKRQLWAMRSLWGPRAEEPSVSIYWSNHARHHPG